MCRTFVFAGVTGSGKSAAAKMVSDETGLEFVEGDHLHPRSNIEKMSKGIALRCEDRIEWLDQIRQTIAAAASRGEQVIITCSALRRCYRKMLQLAGPVTIFWLRVSRDVVLARVKSRQGHFFSHDLVDSQFAAMEEPDETETSVIVLDAERPLEEIAREILARIGMGDARR